MNRHYSNSDDLSDPDNLPLVVRPDAQARALAVVTSMRDELHEAHSAIAQLKTDLYLCQENSKRIDEERRRFRGEALVFRSKLIELATILANVNLATTTAADVMRTVDDLTQNPETPTDRVLDDLARTILPSNEFATDTPQQLEDTVATLLEGARVDPQ